MLLGFLLLNHHFINTFYDIPLIYRSVHTTILNIDSYCLNENKKAENKFSTLARISGYMDSNKLRFLMRAFVISQFQYCPLVWMFHSRHLNNKINRIHERALRTAYKDYESSFNTLLEKDKSVNIHVKNLQTLMIEMFKTRENINPPFMREIFCQHPLTYNLRNNYELLQPKVKLQVTDLKPSNIEGIIFGYLYLNI